MSAEMTNLSDEAQSLARVPLFKRLEPHELEHLAEEIDQVNVPAGETIFHKPKFILSSQILQQNQPESSPSR